MTDRLTAARIARADQGKNASSRITGIVEIHDAQRDVRTVFLGGFAGQLVSSGVWFFSAAAATWLSHKAAALVLIIGGFFIFPLTQLLLRLMKHPFSLPKGHPMNALAMQIAFTLPLSFPLVLAAAISHHSWFYPAFMVALGAHYLPFVFLYGMRQFAVLTAVLVASGILLGLYVPTVYSAGGWLTAFVLLVFALLGRRAVLPRPVH